LTEHNCNNNNDTNAGFATVLDVVGPAAELFVAGISLFEITDFTPPLQRVTIVGINLPDPDTFGPFDQYVATLTVPDTVPQVLDTFPLEPTVSAAGWVGVTFLTFGGTLPMIEVAVRPQSFDDRVGPVILQGIIFGAPADHSPSA